MVGAVARGCPSTSNVPAGADQQPCRCDPPRQRPSLRAAGWTASPPCGGINGIQADERVEVDRWRTGPEPVGSGRGLQRTASCREGTQIIGQRVQGRAALHRARSSPSRYLIKTVPHLS